MCVVEGWRVPHLCFAGFLYIACALLANRAAVLALCGGQMPANQKDYGQMFLQKRKRQGIQACTSFNVSYFSYGMGYLYAAIACRAERMESQGTVYLQKSGNAR